MSEQEYQQRKLLALADMRGMVGEMWADELRRKRRERLREVLEERRIGGKRLSRRVIHVWHYQRGALLSADFMAS